MGGVFPAMSAADLPDVCGYLERFSGGRTYFGRKKWTRYFCVLRPYAACLNFEPSLLMYKTSADADSLGEKPLEIISCLNATINASQLSRNGADFALANGEDVTYLRAGHHAARQDWIEAISNANLTAGHVCWTPSQDKALNDDEPAAAIDNRSQDKRLWNGGASVGSNTDISAAIAAAISKATAKDDAATAGLLSSSVGEAAPMPTHPFERSVDKQFVALATIDERTLDKRMVDMATAQTGRSRESRRGVGFLNGLDPEGASLA